MECEDENKVKCESTKKDEINFYYVPYGTKAEIKNASDNNIKGQVYSDITIKVSTFKM